MGGKVWKTGRGSVGKEVIFQGTHPGCGERKKQNAMRIICQGGKRSESSWSTKVMREGNIRDDLITDGNLEMRAGVGQNCGRRFLIKKIAEGERIQPGSPKTRTGEKGE